tara:strand:+ start:15724 stop:17007 length:1284 start_codon:yes stop_codon:yes gene_type:complete
MSDWTLKDLEFWDNKICDLGLKNKLDWYPITYETCDYFEMIGNMSYHGMPTHYGHWSFGKSFEIQHSQYQHGVTGLPYELIINSDPCISYLMKENPLYLQVLIMAHCVGHSDFFKNNRMFKHTRADTIVPRMRNAKKRIQKYVEDPWIGIEKVEAVIDACQALSYQIPTHPVDYGSLKEEYDSLHAQSEEKHQTIPPVPEYDIMGFILDYGQIKEEWIKDVISIVRDEAYYFMPQIRTKTMNEGWACFWHYKILHELNLDQALHLPFLKSHNQVVRPHIGRINPYHLGFHLFNKIEERFGLKECFIAREVHNDESFLRQYLTQEDCEELNLFAYSPKEGGKTVIDEVSDVEGWKQVKQRLIDQSGSNSIPTIYVDSIEDGTTLVLHHEHDGRDLKIKYAEHVLEHCKHLWGSDVQLITMVDDAPYEI